MLMAPRILVLDNYDSFVYNLVQYIGQLGAEPVVFRNDEIDIAGVEELHPAGVVISPGPGEPAGAGLSKALIAHAAGKVPVLGVCLGHQCIGELYGGTIVRAATLMHGKTSFVDHDGSGIFSGVSSPVEATRYHSLVIDPATVPDELVVTATTPDGTIMGVRHIDVDVEGVQFHPESVLTGAGLHMVENFLTRTGLLSA